MSYPFVASRYRRPDRSGPTLGILFHHAEGGNTVQYLANNPERGVSCHFVIEYTGRVVQMLRWEEIAGTLNPRDRSGDKPYYGHSHLVDVLGDWWTNPNNALIQVEMEGFARTGPNAKQRAAAVTLTADAIHHFPSIRGALGHADQTDTKGCPGTTDAMKGLFASIGGHGLWTPEEPPVLNFTWIEGQPDSGPGTVTVRGDGHSAILADGTLFPLGAGTEKESKGLIRFLDGKWTGQLAYAVGADCAFLLKTDVVYVAGVTDCADQIAAQRERDRVSSLAAIEEVFA